MEIDFILNLLFLIKIGLLSYIDAYHARIGLLFKNGFVIFAINGLILFTIFFEFEEYLIWILVDCFVIATMSFIVYKIKSND